MRAPRVLWPCAFASALLAPATAFAHPETRAYCSVRTVARGFDLDFDLPLHAAVTSDELGRSLLARLDASTPQGPCRPSAPTSRLPPPGREARATVGVHFDCPPGPVRLRCTWGLDRDPRSETLCAIDGAPWLFRRDTPEVAIGTPPRPAASFAEFVEQGARHVWHNPDHVLFLAVLWAGSLTGLAQALAAVVGFSLGHSLSLAAATLGFSSVDPRWIGSLMALSIGVVALENLLIERPRWRALNAALFGLVHGLGMARGLVLPEHGAVRALVGFNLGVELALLAGIAVPAAGSYWARRRPWYRRRVLLPVSISALVIALAWLIRRATGTAVVPWLAG